MSKSEHTYVNYQRYHQGRIRTWSAWKSLANNKPEIFKVGMKRLKNSVVTYIAEWTTDRGPSESDMKDLINLVAQGEQMVFGYPEKPYWRVCEYMIWEQGGR